VPSSRPATYRSYLLRCWRERPGGQRFVVETVSGAPQHHGFESFEDLVAYLRMELAAWADQQSDGKTSQADQHQRIEGGSDE
jgi:hypothetical protein